MMGLLLCLRLDVGLSPQPYSLMWGKGVHDLISKYFLLELMLRKRRGQELRLSEKIPGCWV